MNTNESLVQMICEMNDLEARSYSGRGMFGRECLGIVGKTVADVTADLFDGLDALDLPDSDAAYREVSAALRASRTDSMGMDVIVYFPEIAFVAKEEV